MTISIKFKAPTQVKKGVLVLGILKDNKLTPAAKAWDKEADQTLTRALGESRFKGKVGQTLHIIAPHSHHISRVLLVGLGKGESEKDFQKVGGAITTALSATPTEEAAVHIDCASKLKTPEVAANIAIGAALKSWRFEKYHTKKKPEDKLALKGLTILTEDTKQAESLYKAYAPVIEGAFFTRDLVSEPANILHPETLAEAAKTLTKDGVKVEVLNEKKMKKLGMGSLLGVGQGSEKESHLVVMQWNGAKNKKEPPIAFVGKGVTFDSGGISLKPGSGMEEMKWDMAGSAVVMGTMKALAKRKAKVNAVGVVGLVENMPSGTAQRPGDIVTSMSGQTIEIINTDAEGRLVLADALWYTQDRFKPKVMINLATLTMAVIICLGEDRAGVFSNNDQLAKNLEKAGDDSAELVWTLPMDDVYAKGLKSEAADLKNIGNGPGASSVVAAKFLERFVNDTPWAHIDIAGTTWSNKDLPLAAKGATAFGVRLLDRLVRNSYEGK